MFLVYLNKTVYSLSLSRRRFHHTHIFSMSLKTSVSVLFRHLLHTVAMHRAAKRKRREKMIQSIRVKKKRRALRCDWHDTASQFAKHRCVCAKATYFFCSTVWFIPVEWEKECFYHKHVELENWKTAIRKKNKKRMRRDQLHHGRW